MRHPVILTTIEEDFRKIGLIPEDKRLAEDDDAYVPRDIPSPHPSTKAGLDDSEGDKAAHHASASQPKPAMGPDAEDDEYEPIADGGSEGAQKGKSGHAKVQGDKESSLKGEALIKQLKRQLAEAHRKIAALSEEEAEYEEDPKEAKIGSGKKAKMLGKTKQGEKPQAALGTNYVAKKSTASASMESKTLSRADALIEEVQGLLRGVAVSERSDALVKGFNLVSENAALLADHLSGFTSEYKVEDAITVLESLSADAAKAADIVENFGCDGDDDADDHDHEAHGHDGDEHEKGADAEDENMDVYEDDGDDEEEEESFSMEHAEMAFKAMVSTLMDGLQSYDAILSEMGDEEDEQDEDDEGLLGKLAGGAMGMAAGGAMGHPLAGGLGGALAGDIAQNRLDKPQGGEDEDDDEPEMFGHEGEHGDEHGAEHGGEHGDEDDAAHAHWMDKMEKMKAMMHAMKHGGAHPFRGGEHEGGEHGDHDGEEDESMGGGYAV